MTFQPCFPQLRGRLDPLLGFQRMTHDGTQRARLHQPGLDCLRMLERDLLDGGHVGSVNRCCRLYRLPWE